MAKKKGRPRKKLDDSVFSNRVAAHIIELMTKRSITAEQLHEGMQENGYEGGMETVKKWLQGRSKVDLNAMPALAATLNCRVRTLLPNE
jgi:hypothetical protein